MKLLWIVSLCSLAAANYCPQCKVFAPPKPLPVEVIYEGGSGKCECEKSLPYGVDFPKPVRKEYTHYDYSYKVEAPKETEPEGEVRYNFDYRVETPVEKTCDQCRMKGLVTQVDRMTLPAPECNCPKPESSNTPYYGRTYVPMFRRTRRSTSEDAVTKDQSEPATVGAAQDSKKERFLKKFPRLQRIQNRQQQRQPLIKRSLDQFDGADSFEPTKCSVLEDIRNSANLESFQIPEILQYAPEVEEPINRERKHCKFCNGGSVNGKGEEQCQFCNRNRDQALDAGHAPSQYHEYIGGTSVPYSMKKEFHIPTAYPPHAMPPMSPSYQPYQYPPVFQAYQLIPPQPTPILQQPTPILQQSPEMQPRYVFDRLGHRYVENNGNLRLQPNIYYNDPAAIQMLSDILAHSVKDIKQLNPLGSNTIADSARQQKLDAIKFIKLISQPHPENTHYSNYPVKRSFDVIPLSQNNDGSMIIKISPNATTNMQSQQTPATDDLAQAPKISLPMALKMLEEMSAPLAPTQQQQNTSESLIEPGQIIEIIEVDPANKSLKTDGNFLQAMRNGKKYEVLSSMPHAKDGTNSKVTTNKIQKTLGKNTDGTKKDSSQDA